MSRVVEIKYDCGYVVTFPVTQEPDRNTRRTFELTADWDHQDECPFCKQKMNEEAGQSTA